MKIELVQLMTEITKNAIKHRLTFREAWLIFGAHLYTGYRNLKEVPDNIPSWTIQDDLPDLKLPPDEL